MRSRATSLLAGAVAVVAGAAIAVALWQAQSAVRRAEHRVLEAETTIAARLLREPEGSARVSSMLGARWRRVSIQDSTAGDVVIEASGSGATATAAVLDVDGWDVVGRVEVDEDPAQRAALPLAVCRRRGAVVRRAVRPGVVVRLDRASMRARGVAEDACGRMGGVCRRNGHGARDDGGAMGRGRARRR